MGMKNWEHFHPRSHRVSRTGVVWWIWMCSCERNDISFYLRQSLNFCSNFSCLHFGWWRNFLAGSKCLQLVMRWCQFSCFLSFPPRPACKIDYLFFFLVEWLRCVIFCVWWIVVWRSESAIKKWRDAMHEWFPIFVSTGRMTEAIFFTSLCWCSSHLVFFPHPAVCDIREIDLMTWFNVDFCRMCVQGFFVLPIDRFIRNSGCIRQLLIASNVLYFLSICWWRKFLSWIEKSLKSCETRRLDFDDALWAVSMEH